MASATCGGEDAPESGSGSGGAQAAGGAGASTGGNTAVAGMTGSGGSQQSSGGSTGAGGSTGSGGSQPGSGGSGGGPPTLGCTPSGEMPTLKQTLLVSGLRNPVELVGLPDEPDILWVLEHRSSTQTNSEARIRAIRVNGDSGEILSPNVAAFQVKSTLNHEEGLHSIALHPDYMTNKLFYVFYSAQDNSDTTIAEYTKVSETEATRNKTLWSAGSDRGYHNGGQIDFSPNDKEHIYISIGDNQNAANAQNDDSPNGKIMKVNLASGQATMVHKGLRNPWRFSFDALTGDMYIADVGNNHSSESEKLYFAKADETGRNFGWSGSDTGRPPALHMFGNTTPIIGGFVYRGQKMPGFCGRYIFGTYNANNFWTLQVNADGEAEAKQNHTELNSRRLTAFGRDASGELYFSDFGGDNGGPNTNQGRVFRIDPAQ